MRTDCPNCKTINPINNVSAVETYSFEYKCDKCGYYIRSTEWFESEALMNLNNTLIADRQKKLQPKCEGCGE